MTTRYKIPLFGCRISNIGIVFCSVYRYSLDIYWFLCNLSQLPQKLTKPLCEFSASELFAIVWCNVDNFTLLRRKSVYGLRNRVLSSSNILVNTFLCVNNGLSPMHRYWKTLLYLCNWLLCFWNDIYVMSLLSCCSLSIYTVYNNMFYGQLWMIINILSSSLSLKGFHRIWRQYEINKLI